MNIENEWEETDPRIENPGINSGIKNNLIGYCKSCKRLEGFEYELNKQGWGNTCKSCKSFVPVSEFSQAILLCPQEDIVYSLEKSSKTLSKEFLTKLIIVVEKFGVRIINDGELFNGIYELLKMIAITVLLSGIAIGVTMQMEVIKNYQIYQQSLIK